MQKRAEAFRSIGEVAKMIGVATHVLRYWETQFSQLKPMKRPDGRRYYRPDDVHLAAGLHELLREEGLTIRGAKKQIAKDRGEAVRALGAAKLQNQLSDESVEEDAKLSPDSRPAEKTPSRPAKPRRAAASQELPLFPDLKNRKSSRDWLDHLANLATVLRDTESLQGRAREQGSQLLQAINRLG